MYSVFLSSYRNTRESLEELKKALETLTCGLCSHSVSRSPKLPLMFLYLDRNMVHVFCFLNKKYKVHNLPPVLWFWCTQRKMNLWLLCEKSWKAPWSNLKWCLFELHQCLKKYHKAQTCDQYSPICICICLLLYNYTLIHVDPALRTAERRASCIRTQDKDWTWLSFKLDFLFRVWRTLKFRHWISHLEGPVKWSHTAVCLLLSKPRISLNEILNIVQDCTFFGTWRQYLTTWCMSLMF